MSVGSGRRLAARLDALRVDRRGRVVAVATGIVVGLGVGSIHWVGLVLGGMIVALPARTVPRGLAAGFGLGVLGMAVFAVMLLVRGTLAPALSTGQVGWVSVAIAIGAPLLGSLVRGIV